MSEYIYYKRIVTLSIALVFLMCGAASALQGSTTDSIDPALLEKYLQQSQLTEVSAHQNATTDGLSDVRINDSEIADRNDGLQHAEGSEKDSVESSTPAMSHSKEFGSEVKKETLEPVSASLTRFGYNFFDRAGGNFVPDKLALVGPDYIVGPGDTLKIDVWGNIEGSYKVTLDRNGEIYLPKVGAITLWGQNFSTAEKIIRKQISKYFSKFELNVTMGALRSIQVFIVGEVDAPGTYSVNSLSTILTALSEAGGPSNNGSLRNVQLRRNGKVVATFDMYDFFNEGDKSSDLRLQSGDTIFVSLVGPLVGIAGDVRRPAVYELKGGESLNDALTLAGGVVATAYLKKIQVRRVQLHQEQTVFDVNIDKPSLAINQGEEFILQDRDFVQVAPIADTGGYVELKGYVVRPGRYALSKGMRIADLITPYDNLLPEYYPEMLQLIRIQPPEYRKESHTYNLMKALQNDPQHNVLLEEYDVVRLFSRNEMEETPQVKISGSILQPGTYELFEKMTVKDLIVVAGNLKRSAFLDMAEITRFNPQRDHTNVERVEIDLSKALNEDPQHNRALQVDDHLFIRSIPDYAEKMVVELRGEVNFPGIYTIAKGEKLSSVLQRAGGFTEQAYLRGATFTREEIKEIQKKRMTALINEQEQNVLRVSAEIAQGALSQEEVTAAQSILANQKEMLAKLKSAPVTGRMVVQLDVISDLIVSDDDFSLMDGDVLTIPESPRAVTVLGEVYNPLSIVAIPGKTVDYYLQKVGGPKKSADIDNIFIIRADGTVFSRQQAGSGIGWDSEKNRWVVGGLENTMLFAGDTVLVPEQIEKVAWMREVKDVTTILYQMALGAAAVASF